MQKMIMDVILKHRNLEKIKGLQKLPKVQKLRKNYWRKKKKLQQLQQLKKNFLKIYEKNSIRLKIVDILLQKMT